MRRSCSAAPTKFASAQRRRRGSAGVRWRAWRGVARGAASAALRGAKPCAQRAKRRKSVRCAAPCASMNTCRRRRTASRRSGDASASSCGGAARRRRVSACESTGNEGAVRKAPHRSDQQVAQARKQRLAARVVRRHGGRRRRAARAARRRSGARSRTRAAGECKLSAKLTPPALARPPARRRAGPAAAAPAGGDAAAGARVTPRRPRPLPHAALMSARVSTLVRVAALVTLTVQNAAQALIVKYARTARPPGQAPFLGSSVVLVCELVKLVAAAALLQARPLPRGMRSGGGWWAAAHPLTRVAPPRRRPSAAARWRSCAPRPGAAPGSSRCRLPSTRCRTTCCLPPCDASTRQPSSCSAKPRS